MRALKLLWAVAGYLLISQATVCLSIYCGDEDCYDVLGYAIIFVVASQPISSSYSPIGGSILTKRHSLMAG
jgi:hypothetical protein